MCSREDLQVNGKYFDQNFAICFFEKQNVKLNPMDRHQRYFKRGLETYTRVEFHGESIGAIHFTIILLDRCVKYIFVAISDYQIPENPRHKPEDVL